jgi:hypothetical protein
MNDKEYMFTKKSDIDETQLEKDCMSFDELMDELDTTRERNAKSPKVVKIARRVFYFFRYRILDWPYNIKSYIVTFYQRGRKGVSIYDVFNLDNYHSWMMINALEFLQGKKNGYPCVIEQDFLPAPEDDEAKFNFYLAIWENILNEMITGFKAHKRISNAMYEDEIGPYVFLSKNPTEEEKILKAEHTQKIVDLEKRDNELFEKGMALFTKYYSQLWY